MADIHGKPDRIRQIRRHISATRPHVLIMAGDISGLTSPCRMLRQINALPVPVLYVRGNSDRRKFERFVKQFRNITSIHATRMLMHAIPITGVGGTIPVPFRSKISFAETSLLRRVEPLIGENTVLVVHPPPRGVLDAVLGRFHVGSINLRHFIESVQPRLVICGHIHECAGIGAIGKTRVVNCSMSRNHNGALIDIIPQKELKIALI